VDGEGRSSDPDQGGSRAAANDRRARALRPPQMLRGNARADAATMASALRLIDCIVAFSAEPAPVKLHISPRGAGRRRRERDRGTRRPSSLRMSLDPARLSSGIADAAFLRGFASSALALHPRVGEVAAKNWAVDEGTQPAPAWIPSIRNGRGPAFSGRAATPSAPGRTAVRHDRAGKSPRRRVQRSAPRRCPGRAGALAAVALGIENAATSTLVTTSARHR
jgi:hypothetical protein